MSIVRLLKAYAVMVYQADRAVLVARRIRRCHSILHDIRLKIKGGR